MTKTFLLGLFRHRKMEQRGCGISILGPKYLLDKAESNPI